MSPRIGRGTGFGKWPRLVPVIVDGHRVPVILSDGVRAFRMTPRALPGRKYMNKRGQWQ